MTTIAIADKNRLTVRGVLGGARYLVKRQAAGWWIEPAPKNRTRTRVVKRAKKDLTAHLDALAELSFTFEPTGNGNFTRNEKHFPGCQTVNP